MVKNTSCFHVGPCLNSQHPHGGSQPSITQVSEVLMTLKNAFLFFVLNVIDKIFCVKELEFLYLLKYYHMNYLICQK